MKWGKKKQASVAASSSRSFLISQVLPSSWITKFKQMSMSSGGKHAKVKKQRGNLNYENTNTSSYGGNGGGKFYGGNGDAFWRLSFGEDSLDGMKSTAVFGPGRYNSDADDLEFLPSSCHGCGSKATRLDGKETEEKLSGMFFHARKRLPKNVELLQEVQTCAREKVAEIRTPRLKGEREKRIQKGNQRISEQKQLELKRRQCEAEEVPRKTVVKNVHETTKPGRTLRIVEREDYKLVAANFTKDGCISPLNSRETKIEEDKAKSVEQRRKSLHISRGLQRKRPKLNSKVRVNSPRTSSKAESCRVKALEDVKKAKLKPKKKSKQRKIGGFQGLEGFAVVKCSYDPQKDFRNSMVEMIKDQNISQPEELEELLACYLTLNSDEYHDLIIRVFRQVWYDLNQACFRSESEKNVSMIK